MLVDILRVLDNAQLVSNFQPRASSSFTEENEHALIQKSNKKSCTLDSMPKSKLVRSLDMLLPVTTRIMHQLSQLRLVCSWKKGRKDLSSVMA